jgi:two-component system NtrC family sensor kinase
VRSSVDFFLKMALPGRLSRGRKSDKDLIRYRRIWRFSVTLTLVVALVPLLVMTMVNYYLFRKNINAEVHYNISRNVTSISRSLEFIVEERMAALKFLVIDKPKEELFSDENLAATFKTFRQSFGGFIDLGVIDANGDQHYYTGPYNLLGDNYSSQDWFREIALRDVYVSDVFLGHRQFPHFVIAIKHESTPEDFFVLRATVDMELLNRQIASSGGGPGFDVFMINESGILQTPSRSHGEVLGPCPLPVPPRSSDIEVIESRDEGGRAYLLGYSYIQGTPFILMVFQRHLDLTGDWLKTRTDLFLFMAISVILIMLVILWSSTTLVRHILAADIKRAQVMHNAEYTNKMASIGRLAATVAHEINNPLAIINEKAGLLKDIATAADDYPYRDKTVTTVESIIRSVGRCSAVTHRLLGFTRKLESKIENIDLPELLEEVFGFLGKETSHRNIKVRMEYESGLPTIANDRGKLQQIFLNIINNSIAALVNGGTITLGARSLDENRVEVTISDDGPGIPESDMDNIFEPFFSTKGAFGTGLGLSITYDLVTKLGGEIKVDSEVGRGTRFTVILPLESD